MAKRRVLIDEKLGMERGANAFVRKPFRAGELLQKIETLLAASRQAREVQS